MPDFRAKNPCVNRTFNRTMKAAGNRTCIITRRLSDFKSQATIPSVKSFIFLLPVRANPSRSFVPIVLEIHKREDNETPPHFIFELKTKGYDIIGIDVFFQQHNEIPPPKKVNSVPNILLKALTNTGTYSDKN